MHKQYLLIALDQALLGRGLCAPNPSVGALAVQNNKIIAQAWHRGAGTQHAEQLLLSQFSAKTPDVTLYVTLEPCNHHGRTPPCVDAMIEHGIRRVVYAHRDPNPVVLSGDTPKRLRQHGIEVLQVTVPEIEQFYQSYDHWTATGMPWVTAKIAQSFDGKIAGVHQARLALSNAACHAFTHQQRLKADIILTTAKTIRLDNPWMTARVQGNTHAKPLAILDTSLCLLPDLNVFKAAQCCHIYHDVSLEPGVASREAAPISERISARAGRYYQGIQPHGLGLDLKAVLAHLGRSGYQDVWVEAGGTLFSALHQEKLVDRTYVYLVPKTLGPDATPAYLSADVLNNHRSVRWHVMDDNLIAELEWGRIADKHD